MATFVILYKYTEQGIKNIKEAPKRVEAAKKTAAKAGLIVKETLWLQGEYDFMSIVEGDEMAGPPSTSTSSNRATFTPTPCAPSRRRR
jgi:uncharacterized protein with GYD domain